MQNNQNKWPVRNYRDGDEHQLYELRRAVHPERYKNKKPWLEWWHWQYKEYPYGIKTLIVEDNGKIIGHAAVRLINLKVDNDIIKARTPFDLATHPDYQRRGVALAIGDVMRDHLDKTGNYVMFVTPNRDSRPFGKKTGSLDVSKCIKLYKILNWENLLSKHIRPRFLLRFCSICLNTFEKLFLRAKNIPSISGIAIKQVTRFDERINELLKNFSDRSPIMVVKNMDYLNWRYTTFMKENYIIYTAEKELTICGYLILGKSQDRHDSGVYITELIAESEDIAQNLIFTAVEYCRKINMDYISWAGLANKSYVNAFRKQGFFSLPRKNLMRFTIMSHHPSIPDEYLTDPRNWFLQIGDLDYY